MPTRLLSVALALLFVLIPAMASTTDDAEGVLRKSEYFVLGVLGRGGGSSPQTAAMRKLLAQPDAVARFEGMCAETNPVIKAYGLAGLKYAGSPKYAEKARTAAQVSDKVSMITGDVARRVTFQEFLTRLERDYPTLPPESAPARR